MRGETNPHFQEAFGRVLRRLRKDAQLSQEALGFESELQRNYVSLIELGKYQPTISTLFKLAYALKITPSSMLKQVEIELADQRQTKRRK
jgi:transcriptional regulator with XRE-family HTH domain